MTDTEILDELQKAVNRTKSKRYNIRYNSCNTLS